MKSGDIQISVLGYLGLIFWFPSCFFLCNFGEQVASHYFDLSDAIYNIPWRLCQLETKKLLIPMIIISRKPVYLEGFAQLQCSRETYKKVIAYI